MRNRDFDVFAESRLDPEFREVFERLRHLVEEAAPTAHEVMSNGSPAWQGKRILAVVSPGSSQLSITFERGAALSDGHGFLEGVGFNKRHITLIDPDDLPEEAVRDYFIQAALLDDPSATAF